MKRPLKPEEARVWGLVAATVHPLPGRETPKVVAVSQAGRVAREAIAARPSGPNDAPDAETSTRSGPRSVLPSRREEGTKVIEPRRKHRITRERDEIGARLDLHGYDQDRARSALESFLRRAWDEGYRAVLVITGKGVQGDGVLRRRAPEWLAASHLSPIVAGIAEAHRRHGGEGALYVALKRKPKP